ncbi:MAG: peptidase C15 [Cyanobacteria bacterium J06621_8]
MHAKILLTSFQTWLPHHTSNSSDDLLVLLQQQHCNDTLNFLRQLPVDIQLASQKVISSINTLQPKGIICCGMAERRQTLTIESQARCQSECLQSVVNISELIESLSFTQISHDAGKFVCEGLYYQILNYLRGIPQTIPCIFVHVPILNQKNQELILQDLNLIIQYLTETIRVNKMRSHF